MRPKTLALCILATLLLPACSLVFGGDRYTGGTSDDAGPTETDAFVEPGTDANLPGIDTGVPIDARAIPDAFEVACSESDPCASGSYCREAMCVTCDEDEDGYADTDTPASCVTSTVRAGDCGDPDAAMHPWALPDCMRATTETCGTGVGLFSGDNYEAGYRHAGIVTGGAVRNLHVFPLATMGRSIRVLVVFRTKTNPTPQYAVARFDPVGAVALDAMGELPSWSVSGALPTDSELAASRGADGLITVVTIDANEGNLSIYSASTMDGETWRLPVGERRIIGGVSGVSEIYAAGVTSDAFGAPAAVASFVASGFARNYLLGVTTSHQEEVTTAWPVEPLAAHSGSGGVAFVDRSSFSLFRLWSGELGAGARYAMIDSGSAMEGAYASHADGTGRFGVVAAAAGSDRLQVALWQCNASSCTTYSGMPSFTTSPTALSAEWLFSSAYMIAGRNFGGTLSLGALDISDPATLAITTRTFEDVGPAGWVATDVGGRVESIGGSGVATLAVAMTTDSGAELFVLRSCFSP
ncbi:MAG: hypothetical protein J0L92_04710 [Deltaproteobacteria bacterium]|nr:hypothetical protein [Deltaproteobacteria bacterium]